MRPLAYSHKLTWEHLGKRLLIALPHIAHQAQGLPIIKELEGLGAVELRAALVLADDTLDRVVGIRVHCTRRSPRQATMLHESRMQSSTAAS